MSDSLRLAEQRRFLGLIMWGGAGSDGAAETERCTGVPGLRAVDRLRRRARGVVRAGQPGDAVPPVAGQQRAARPGDATGRAMTHLPTSPEVLARCGDLPRIMLEDHIPGCQD